MTDRQTHRLKVHVLGTGPRRALALHCSLAHGRVWAGLSRALPGLTLHAPDLPGHGESPDWDGTDDYHDHCTAQSLTLLQGLATQGPVDLLGHSFGATLALRLALERPDLVRSLTLFEPVLFCAARQEPEFSGFLDAQAGYDAAAKAGDWPKAARLFNETWGSGEGWSTLPDTLRGYLTARMPLVTSCDAVLLHDSAGLLAANRLETITQPVLLAEGMLSPPIVGAVMRVLVARITNARHHRVAGAGHMLPITHARDLAPLVAAHFGQ